VNVCIPVTTIAAGPDFACGLLTDGHVKCWGNSGLGLSPAALANVLFKSITAGNNFMCGIRDNGLAYCWGNNAPTVKAGTFYALAAGTLHVCGIKSNRTLDCWTKGSGDETTNMPAGAYQGIASGTDYSCAIVQGGNLNGRGDCWGVGSTTFSDFPDTSSTLTYAQMHGAGLGGWGVRADGSLTSWGKILFSAPSGTIVKTLADGPTQNRCGILADNTLTCWGTPGSEATIPPSGKFRAITMGGNFGCGVKSGGSVTCWGSNDQGQAPASVSGTFQGYW
jgi:Regulator of chromosome condensation (RCC1) repeat